MNLCTLNLQPPEITSLPIAAVLLKEDTQIKTSLHTLTYTDDVDVTLVTCSIESTDPTPAPFMLQLEEGTTGINNELRFYIYKLERFTCTCGHISSKMPHIVF